MTLDEYLNLTDNEIQFLIAFEYGEPYNDAFHGSVIRDKRQKIDKEDIQEDIDDDQDLKEIPEVGHLEKFQDQDIPTEE